jgi:hypothetical protein
MASNTILLDGRYTNGFYVGRPVINYPFLVNGDSAAVIIEREWRQSESTFVPGQLGVSKDPKFADAYLLKETTPFPLGIGDTIRVGRTFGRIPDTQTTPISYLFSAPNFTPVDWASGAYPPANGYDVSTDYAVIAIQSAFEGARVSNATFAAIRGYYAPEVAITAYTGTPSTTITAPGHGCSAGSRVVYRRSTSFFYFDVSSVSGDDIIGTSTSITTTGAGAEGQNLFGVILPVADFLIRRVRNTTDTGQTINLPAQEIEDFYLLGVTTGINSITDIPSQSPYSLSSYLAAWAAASTWFNVQASQIERWMGTPILRRAYVQAALGSIT